MRLHLVSIVLLILANQSNAQILKKTIPNKTVVFTFDDAPISQFSVVAPLLKKYGFNATFFVCEFPPNYKDSTLYMNWRQIQTLDRMGFEVGNHTQSHAHVDKLNESQFNLELSYIEDKCDSLGINRPISFAYPAYGLNDKSLEYLNTKGYTIARAGGSRAYNPLRDHPYLVPSWATNADNKKEIFKAFKKAKKGKIVVLTFHGVPDIEHPWVNTPPELFEEYLKYLYKHQYNVLAIRDLQEYIDFKEASKTLSPDLDKPLRN